MRDEARPLHMRKKPIEVGAGASIWLCPDCERPGLLREATDTSNASRAETLIEEDRERKGKN
ncbi:hypothetical protein GE21DRAFT_1196475 [Neurospora crassa]|nr:hypothetical protein GE21DRAFT_1196475 [Neurospora crassa]